MARVLCVVGPTATGKTKMGVALAQRFGGEVVSVDSMQLYRGMEIGTAAPTMQERGGIPHYMVSVADPAEQWSVARYVEQADGCVQDILRRGKLPVLVGGTGLYLDALVQGLDFAEGHSLTPCRRELEERMAREGGAALLRELSAVDGESAARLHPSDEKRIIRALEVYYTTGRTITDHNRATKSRPPRYEALWIGLDFLNRPALHRRIDLRVEQMVKGGLLQEVSALLQRGLPESATAWQAIGYKQFLSVAKGLATVDEAVEEVKLRSRQYAKRQRTWLRRNGEIFWVRWDDEPNFSAGLHEATEYLRRRGLP